MNRLLPAGYFAEANVQFGIEIDVAAFEERGDPPTPTPPAGGGWTPPAPVQTVPFALGTDTVEVLIYQTVGGPTLAGAVELVSPANKDRAAHRDAFVSKCAAYLQQGLGLAIVDVVTDRSGNLHNELLQRVRAAASPLAADLYAAAYHPVQRNDQPNLDIWTEALVVGRSLPTLPLCIRGGLCLPVELEATYDRTCREQRVPGNGA